MNLTLQAMYNMIIGTFGAAPGQFELCGAAPKTISKTKFRGCPKQTIEKRKLLGAAQKIILN